MQHIRNHPLPSTISPRIVSIPFYSIFAPIMTFKVGIIGPESTAKSTLSQQLAKAFGGVYIPEYAREYIANLSRPYTYDDVSAIAHHQIQQLQITPTTPYPLSHSVSQCLSDSVSQSLSDSVTPSLPSDAAPIFPPVGGTGGGLLFYDTELIITKVWFLHKYNTCPTFLLEALDNNPIDFYLLCAPDLPFVPDPLRENPHLRDHLFQWYERELQAYHKPYAIIRGEGPARLQSAIQALQSHLSTHL